jgi:putative DNA primase/helicase
MSYADALTDFIAAMELEGVKPVEPIASRLSSGELIRFRCDGDGKGRQNGWAILYLDERPAGAFGNYRLGISRKWRVGREVSLTPAERAAMQREWAEAKQKRQEERDLSEAEAERDAADMWEAATRPDPAHGYLAKKGMDGAGLRQLGDRLLVPMFDAEGTLRNLQRIAPDGTKRFLRGGRTTGLFFLLGQFRERGETTAIGEGLATMSAVHRATGYPSIVTFSAKNLQAVARLWWSLRPDLDFVICGDDDSHLPTNVGREATIAAAEEIGARYVFPSAVSA